MPLHPWQLKSIISVYLKEIIDEKLLIGPLFNQATFPAFDKELLLPHRKTSPSIRSQLDGEVLNKRVMDKKTRAAFKNFLKKNFTVCLMTISFLLNIAKPT